MPFSQSNGVVVNKPIGLVGKSTDLRSQFYDSSTFTYRDYASISEALAWLTVTGNQTATNELRKGHFPVYVTESGVTTTYYFKDDLTTLVPMITGGSATTDASQLTSGILAPARIADTTITASKLSKTLTPTLLGNSITVAAWGDSLTKGTGGFPTPEFPEGTPWMATFKNITGYNFYNGGYPGQISTYIKDQMIADTAKRSWPVIIWVGTNNLGQNSTILADIAAMVASLGHTRYLIVNLPGHSSSAFWSGTGNYTALMSLNASIASTYGVRAVDIRTPLVAAYNPNNSQDVIDHSHDIVPTSLMYSGDAVHFSDVGYKIIGQTIAAKAQYLELNGAEEAVFTTTGLKSLLSSPLGIGVTAPNVGRFTSIAINKPLVQDVTLGLSSAPSKIVLDIAGSVRILAPNGVGGGGLLIKARANNEGEVANMEICGTATASTPGKGIVFYNNIDRITFGTAEVLFAGDITTTSSVNTGQVVSTGTIYSQAFASSYPVTRVADFTNSNGYVGGLGLPIVSSTAGEPGLFVAKKNEIFFNDETGRVRVGHKYSGNTNLSDYKTLAYTDEITSNTFLNGAGISINQSGNNITISNALLAPAAQLTGTPFENPYPDSNWDGNAATYGVVKAFDNDVNTFYKSPPSDINNNRWVGLDFGSKYILTKFQIICIGGYDYIGAKLQGSNDNTTYTDLFTISSINTYNDTVNEYAISSITPYKYVRFIQTTAAYLLAVKELKCFGYQSTDISVSGGALALNNTTKVLSLPAATNSVDGYLTAADHTTFAAKQAPLVSGTNIKTINGTSLLGSGDIVVSGGGGTVDTTIIDGSSNPPTGNAVFDALVLKANISAPILTGDVTLSTGNLIISTAGKGFIVKSDDGTSTWRLRVSNTGVLDTVAVP